MYTAFPYTAKRMQGWETFCEYHRFFVRNLLVVGALFSCIGVLALLPERFLVESKRGSIFLVLAALLLADIIYFTIANHRRFLGLRCPRCNQRFFGYFGRHRCKNCGIGLWAPIVNENQH